MPGKDGTGPRGIGSSVGRRGKGQGCCRGTESLGNCKCPGCGNTQPHTRGVPCVSVKCSKCGTAMIREN